MEGLFRLGPARLQLRDQEPLWHFNWERCLSCVIKGDLVVQLESCVGFSENQCQYWNGVHWTDPVSVLESQKAWCALKRQCARCAGGSGNRLVHY
jgi:hypothetical protein